MKIGPHGSQEPLPLLPIEIIEHIITYLDAICDATVRQKSLWSCCLLSRSWYSACVKALYRSPTLSGRNFDRFYGTICPAVTSTARAIGLENLVVDLDMRVLAYESTKSKTARLLRRVRNGLETFIAPAVSFSLAGLVPLSKSPGLRSLDLSNDHYQISIEELLRATRDLEQLQYFSLPRGALRTSALSILRFAYKWPPALTHIQLNGALPDSSQEWDGLIASFPETLTVLGFEHLRDHSPFWTLQHSIERAPQVRRIAVGEPAREMPLKLRGIFKVFSEVRKLKMPLSSWQGHEFTLAPVESRLEQLWLQEGQFHRTIVPSMLNSFARSFPALHRVELPGYALQAQEADAHQAFDEVHGLLKARKREGSNIEAGVVLVQGGVFSRIMRVNKFWT